MFSQIYYRIVIIKWNKRESCDIHSTKFPVIQSSTLDAIIRFLLRSDLFAELGNRHIWVTKERQLYFKILLQTIGLCNMLLIFMAELGINMFHQNIINCYLTFYQIRQESDLQRCFVPCVDVQAFSHEDTQWAPKLWCFFFCYYIFWMFSYL